MNNTSLAKYNEGCTQQVDVIRSQGGGFGGDSLLLDADLAAAKGKDATMTDAKEKSLSVLYFFNAHVETYAEMR